MKKIHYFCKEINKETYKTMHTTIQYHLFLAITCAFLLIGCRHSGKSGSTNENVQVQVGDTIINKVRKPVNFSGTFYQITNLGTTNIIFKQGPYNLEVEGPEGSVDDLAFSIDYNVLTVSMKNEEKIDMNQFNNNKDKLTVYISCPKLQAIAACGTGDIRVEGSLKGDEFHAGCLGTGSIKADTLNVTNLRYDSSGEGNFSFDAINAESAFFVLSSEGALDGNTTAKGPVIIDSNDNSHISLSGKARKLSLIISGDTKCDLGISADSLDIMAQSGEINLTGQFKTKHIDKTQKAKVTMH